MNFTTDSSKNPYIEILLENDENVRVTYIANSWANEGGFRIQIRQVDGHLRQGPEIPASTVSDVIAAIVKLLNGSK